MIGMMKPTHTSPGEVMVEDDGGGDYYAMFMVNDSLGTVDIADSSGTDEEKETGDARAWNMPTRED